MRRISVALLLVVALGAGALLLPSACFSPKNPPCAFSCLVPPHRCPNGYTCGDDGYCHNDNVRGQCPLGGDDAGIDGDRQEG